MSKYAIVSFLHVFSAVFQLRTGAQLPYPFCFGFWAKAKIGSPQVIVNFPKKVISDGGGMVRDSMFATAKLS